MTKNSEFIQQLGEHIQSNLITLEELRELNKKVLDAINMKHSIKGESIKFVLKIGDVVNVDTPKTKGKLFTVKKMNPKKAVIKDENGKGSNCPYSIMSIAG